MSSSATSIAVDDAVVVDADGKFRPATTANRASYGRARGVAMTAADTANRSFQYQVAGIISDAVAPGAAGDWIVVDANGALERKATPVAGDDVIGRCPHTSGDVQVMPGVWDSDNTSPGEGVAPGTSGQMLTSDGAGGMLAGGAATATTLDLSGRLRIASTLGAPGEYAAWFGGFGGASELDIGAPILGIAQSYPAPWGNSGYIELDLFASSDRVLDAGDVVYAFTRFFNHSSPGTISFPADVPAGYTYAYWRDVFNDGASTLTFEVDGGSGSTVDVAAGECARLWINGDSVYGPFGGTGGGGSLNTANGSAPQSADEVDTTNATPTNIGTAINLATDSVTTVDVAVQCIQAGASKCKIFNVRRSFLNNGGTVTDGTQTDLITAEEIGGSLAASVAITRTTTTVQPKVTGVSGTELRWYLISQSMAVTAGAQTYPDAPTAISPTTGDTAGGDVVQITVPNSTGLTGAKVGGVALTAFSIVNGTTVQGTTGAHAAGEVDVVVTNAAGDGPPFVGGFEYGAEFLPSSVGSVRMDLDARFVLTSGSNVTEMTDQSGNGWDATPIGTSQPTIDASVAAYAGLPAVRFTGDAMLETPIGSAAIPLSGGHSPMTVAIVGHYDLDETSAGGFTFCVNGNTYNIRESGGNWQLMANAATALDTSAKACNSASILIVVSEAGGTWRLYRNGKTAESMTMANNDLSSATGVYQIGNFGAGAGTTYVHDGPLSRCIVWDEALTDGEVGTALDGLGALYGITIAP